MALIPALAAYSMDLIASMANTWPTKQIAQRQMVGVAAKYASPAGNSKCEFLQITWPQDDRQVGLIRTIRVK
jgi:hypothetical protein